MEQDESQPTDTDASFGDLTVSDAEREADGKAKLKETGRRKKRRETPDSKDSSEFSGSPTVGSSQSVGTLLCTTALVLILLSCALIQDSLSDKKSENESPESSSESVEVSADNSSSSVTFPRHYFDSFVSRPHLQILRKRMRRQTRRIRSTLLRVLL